MVAFRLRQMSLLHSTSYATHRRPAVQTKAGLHAKQADASFRSLTVGKPQDGVRPTAREHRWDSKQIPLHLNTAYIYRYS